MDHHYTKPSRLTLLGYRFVYDPLRRGELRRLVSSLGLAGSERVLVFGSGAGSEADLLAAALHRGGRLTCFDVSPTWLAEARRRLRRYDNVDFLLGEATEHVLPADAYDVIVANFVLHDVDRTALPATLAALAGALHGDGRFVVVEPVGSRHSLPPGTLPDLMAAAGLEEISNTPVRTLLGAGERSVFRHRRMGVDAS
jgi:ubiquinone/menaquinone biosynthesis C-methylase UbiE